MWDSESFSTNSFSTESWLFDVTVPPDEHHGGGHKRSELCVISVDGQDYRVRFENLQEFLNRQKERTETSKAVRIKKSKKSKKSKTALVKNHAPKIVVKYAPTEYKQQIQASIDRSNEILRKIWEAKLTLLINEAEHEEAMALILMMEDF